MVGIGVGVGMVLGPLHGMHHDQFAMIYRVDRNLNSISVDGDGAVTWSVIVNVEVYFITLRSVYNTHPRYREKRWARHHITDLEDLNLS